MWLNMAILDSKLKTVAEIGGVPIDFGHENTTFGPDCQRKTKPFGQMCSTRHWSAGQPGFYKGFGRTIILNVFRVSRPCLFPCQTLTDWPECPPMRHSFVNNGQDVNNAQESPRGRAHSYTPRNCPVLTLFDPLLTHFGPIIDPFWPIIDHFWP